MRDKERIPELMVLLQKIWSKQPDIRFNQLIHNLQNEYNKENEHLHTKSFYERTDWKGVVSFQEHKHGYIDLFNVEDYLFIKFLYGVLDE